MAQDRAVIRGSARIALSRPVVATLVPLCAVGVLLAVALPRSNGRVTQRSAVALRASENTTSSSHPDASVFVSGGGAETVAGTGAAGFSGDHGSASSAELDGPGGIAEDRSGDLFIADTGNCRVREVPAHTGTQFSVQMVAGHIYTVAGGACGTKSDQIGFVSSVAVDSSDDLFIADPTNDTVLELPARGGDHFGTDMSAGKLAVVAGTGTPGLTGEGQRASSAQLDDPQGISLDAEGDLLIADTANCEVREVASHDGTQWGIPMTSGHIYRIAGTGSCGQVRDGGSSTSAELWDPVDVASGPAGDVLVSDAGAEEVLDLAPRTGEYYGVRIDGDHLAEIAGIGSYGPYLIDGLPATGEVAELNSPTDIAVTSTGDLLISDTYSSCIRELPDKIESERGVELMPGDMYTIAGALTTGSGHWVGTQMLYPVGLAVAPDGTVVFSDQGANVVRELRARA